MHDRGDIDLRKLKARSADIDNPTEEIDLLKDLMRERDDVDLPINNPDENFRLRKEFLHHAMLKHGM